VAPLEPWEKVLVDGENFPQTVHGQISCIDCHGGNQSSEKESAHNGIIRNPSDDPEEFCSACHEEIVTHTSTNLHANLAGYWTVLEQRTIPDNHPQLEEMFGNHCSSCHASCGECHVSQPDLVGGGFIEGHMFNETPSMTRNCTACHGSRIGNEFLGKHEGLTADVHFRQGRMNCISCHSGAEMHGEPAECNTCHPGPEGQTILPADHRYSGVQSPRCESCHTPVSIEQDDVIMHKMHGNELSCQVCHSISYTSCDGCHVALSESTGNPFFETQDSYLNFLIGRNPIQSYDRPYTYVTLRHVPVYPEAFDYYGENLLPNFDFLETWKYTTPHNIQRETPQTASCDACHGNPEFFLTEDKVSPEEIEANKYVIVGGPPPPIAELFDTPKMPSDHEGLEMCQVCHADGLVNAPKNPQTHLGYSEDFCNDCHPGP
jgi:thiosulfate/3-mercaptopyruvate sulfurtransferase